MANEIANLQKEHVNFRKLLALLETQLGIFSPSRISRLPTHD